MCTMCTTMETEMLDSGLLLRALKDRYFKLAVTENIPNTPEVTKEMDHIEESIRKIVNTTK